MDSTERQVIDELFDKIRRAESRSGPRDPHAEARIREHLAEQPAAPYYMAQAILIQEQALAAANARIEQLERQLSEQPAGGFLGGLFGTGGTRPVPAQPSRADGWDPRIAAYANPRYGRRGGGFLAGAMQTAMGVAGGVLLGSAIASMFTPDPASAAEEPVEDAPEHDFDAGGFDEDF
jgi:uncharacterized protein